MSTGVVIGMMQHADCFFQGILSIYMVHCRVSILGVNKRVYLSDLYSFSWEFVVCALQILL